MASKWWDKTVTSNVGPDETHTDHVRVVITSDGKCINLDTRDIYLLKLVDSLTESDITEIYR